MADNSYVNRVLKDVAKGTGILIIGTVISMFLGFLTGVIIARKFSVEEYGIYRLTFTILSLMLIISRLGLHNYLPREIAFYIERKQPLDDLISSAYILSILDSTILMIILLIFSDYISYYIFHNIYLRFALKVIALSIPFVTLTNIVISIFRGFGRVVEQVYFQNILSPFLFFIFILVCILLNTQLIFIFISYLIIQIIIFFILVLYTLTKNKFLIFNIKLPNIIIIKDVLKFSLPLMFMGIAGYIMTWTDTLMLGYFTNAKIIGLYNTASQIAKFLLVFLNSAGFIYPALVTRLYAQNQIEEFCRVYQILTKWLFFASLPIFSLMYIFPKITLNFIFGSKYISSAIALQILSLGFMFHTILGLNGWSLIIIKENKFLMYSTFISALINVILNILLIPVYGMIGAAIATTISYFVINILNSLKLYIKLKIHPFSKNYLKLLIIGIFLIVLIKNLYIRYIIYINNILNAILVLLIFLIIFTILMLISKSIDKEDIELLSMIKNKILK